MNIKDAYIHNGDAILKDIQLSGSKLQKLKAGKKADDTYLTWVDVLDLSPFGASGHNHDDRYYTESEIDTKLATKSDIGHTHTKSQITDFPTSLPANGGYADGITSKDMLDSQEKIDNFITANKLEYALFKTADVNNVDFASNDGMLLSIPWASTTYGFQMAFDDTHSGTVKVRSKSDTWGNWYTLLHSGNYTTYTVKKDGTGASGTWGISITGNAKTATTSTYASNVGSAGTAGTNYVTASKVIATCNWYDTMISSDSDDVINKWSEIVSFVAGFKETPDLATFLSNNYLAKAGGTMTGPLKWKDDNALPQQTYPQYFLCIDAFDGGGTTKWANKADTLNALTGLTSTAIGDSDEPVYWNGSKFVKAGAYPTKSSWNYDDVYLKLSGGTLTGSKNVLTLSNNSGGDIGLKFSRNTNTSWEIIDTGGNLKFNELFSNTSILVLYENSQGSSAVFKGRVSATGFSKLHSSFIFATRKRPILKLYEFVLTSEIS